MRGWLILLVWHVGCGPASEAPRDLPDIILVTIDTLRADRLSCYGYFRETSPFLDGLARQAIRFEHAYAPMATTLPSHVSLLTSTRPARHGIRANMDVLGRTVTDVVGLRTLAMMLSGIGYETGAFVSGAPLKQASGIGIGFDRFGQPDGAERRAGDTIDEALQWLEGVTGSIFLWIHLYDPHEKYDPPPDYRGAFPTDERQLEYLERCGVLNWKSSERQGQSNLYDGEILYADAELARLAAGLQRSGRFDDAAIVVVGDHGESLGEHKWVGHGRIHRETLRVPLLVKLPGYGPDSARVEKGPVALIDVLPMLFEELGIPLSNGDRKQLEGINPLRSARDYVLAERVRGRPAKVGKGERWALLGDRWSLYHGSTGEDALFDLWDDPYERTNVREEHPWVAKWLLAELSDRLAVEEALPTVDSAADSSGVSEEHLDELRALGYVE